MKDNRPDHKHIEILAPAGSYESFRAAIVAGADAVYAGGPRFGARAFANNFTEEELLHAIDYAHVHGRKLYLTVNTLLKEDEINNLHAYLNPLYMQGLDAVIVQDIGVLAAVREWFPDMDIHASTQMTITNTEGALFLKECGVERVVPARELSIKEITDIVKATGLEMECFVHGALCYCYSGQCLLSSMIGGRSGNRGQCAQPCRLPYDIGEKKEYALSLKDICTLDMIPKLVEAGIDSFKIEGRMKKPEYVALVTSMYRKYTDLYLQNGGKEFQISATDKEMLLDIYNRGGFSEGYYNQHNGAHMVSLDRPNHAGIPAVKIVSQKGREAVFQALTQIHKGDILELTDKKTEQGNYTFGKEMSKGSEIQILLPKGIRYSKGTVLYRVRNQALLDSMQQLYVNGTVQEKIAGNFYAEAGKPAMLTVCCGEQYVTVETKSDTETPKNQPMANERIEAQLQKTGDTEFVFESLEVATNGPIFLPMQQLNELRREALDALYKELVQSYRRNSIESLPETVCHNEVSPKVHPPKLTALVETKEQAEGVLNCPEVVGIYLEFDSFCENGSISHIRLLCEQAKKRGKEVFLALPRIFRNEAKEYFVGIYEHLMEIDFDGILIRNYESFYFFKNQGFDKEIILDHNLYVFNRYAKGFWKTNRVNGFTASVEQNHTELKRLGIEGEELIVYGYLPVMTSAQCVHRTTTGCTKTNGATDLRDRYGETFSVRRCCQFCYTVMYFSKALYLLDQSQTIKELAPGYIRMQFTTEGKQQTVELLRRYKEEFCAGEAREWKDTKFTGGHFKRGIT